MARVMVVGESASTSLSVSEVSKVAPRQGKEKERTYRRVTTNLLPLSIPRSNIPCPYSTSPILTPLSGPLFHPPPPLPRPLPLPPPPPFAALHTSSIVLFPLFIVTLCTVTARLSLVPAVPRSRDWRWSVRQRPERASCISLLVFCRVKWM